MFGRIGADNTCRHYEIDAALQQGTPVFIEPGDEIGNGKHRIVSQPARHRARVPRLSHARHTVVAHIAANAGHDGHRHVAGNHHRPLFDMQFQPRFGARRIEEHRPFTNRIDIGTGFGHALAERASMRAMRHRQIGVAQFAEQRAGPHVGFPEPRAFFATQREYAHRRRRRAAATLLFDKT